MNIFRQYKKSLQPNSQITTYSDCPTKKSLKIVIAHLRDFNDLCGLFFHPYNIN